MKIGFDKIVMLFVGLVFAPFALAVSTPISGYAYITNQLDDTVSVITIPGGELIASLTVSANPAAITICGTRAIVSSTDAHQITLIDLETHATQIIDFGDGPFGVDCDEDTAYIGDWFTHQVYSLALEDDISKVKAMPIAVGKAPAGVLLNTQQQHLYVANRDDDTLSVVDLTSGNVIATLATGDAPYGLALNPVRNELYVINVRSSDVTVIDITELKVIAHWEVGEWPYCGIVNHDGSRLYVTNQEDATLSMLDTETGETLHTIEISEVPEGVDITPDQRFIVTVGWESGTIDIIDAATLKTVRQQKAGKGSRSFGRFITPTQPMVDAQ